MRRFLIQHPSRVPGMKSCIQIGTIASDVVDSSFFFSTFSLLELKDYLTVSEHGVSS